MHNGYHVLHAGLFNLLGVSVTFDRQNVAISAYDAVNDVIACAVFEKNNSAPLDLAVLKSSQSHLVPPVHKERIHTVSPYSDGCSTSLGN